MRKELLISEDENPIKNKLFFLKRPLGGIRLFYPSGIIKYGSKPKNVGSGDGVDRFLVVPNFVSGNSAAVLILDGITVMSDVVINQ